MRSSGCRPYIYIYRDSASVESTRGGSLTLAPIIANTRAGARSSAYSTEQLDPVSELHSMYARARAQAGFVCGTM